MDHLYERLVYMLGKPPNDPCLEHFIKDVGVEPRLLLDKKSHREYDFNSLGVWIGIDKRQNQIKTIVFHFHTASVKHGNVAPYQGNLPAGIKAADNREIVAQKLGLVPDAQMLQGRTPEDPKDYWDKYQTGELQSTFIFDGTTGTLDMLSVLYTKDNVPPEPPPPEPHTYLEERCGKSALKTIERAQFEAGRLHHSFVGSESLLLGLLGESGLISAKALKASGVSLSEARVKAEQIVGRGKADGPVTSFTPGAKRILEKALAAAEQLDSQLMESEHILLGLLDVGEGVGNRILELIGVDEQKLRSDVLRLAAREK